MKAEKPSMLIDFRQGVIYPCYPDIFVSFKINDSDIIILLEAIAKVIQKNNRDAKDKRQSLKKVSTRKGVKE